MIKNLSAMQETGFQDLDWEYHLEKGIATHSRILACRIPWREEPLHGMEDDGLQSMGLQRVGHN